jgi:hypothetical protein
MKVRESVNGFKDLSGYIYIKGVFYIQLIESKSIDSINRYIQHLTLLLSKKPALTNIIRVFHQTY